jgi:citrate lyase subunit beta/citryl-CoA lyase
MAIHPAQVPIINEAFTPSAESIAHARSVVEAFAKEPGAGVVGLNGEMLDRPHLARAERILARTGSA